MGVGTLTKKDCPVRILAWNSYWEMKVQFKAGGIYTYHNVSPFWKEKIERFLHKRNYSSAVKALLKFSQVKKEA